MQSTVPEVPMPEINDMRGYAISIERIHYYRIAVIVTYHILFIND